MPRTITLARLAVMLSTAASASAMAQGADAQVPSFKGLDSMEARVQGCVTCHGKDGQGSGRFPRISGKPSGYLYNQLTYFRDGTRHYPPMNYLLAYLPDSYLREMANYFSSQRTAFVPSAPAGAGASAATLARGQAVVTTGDTQKGIPACMACHGERLTGMNPGIPGLAGLSQTYIAAQLTRWRVGERHALDPDCMKRIASRLSDSDITAVSTWLSEQRLPANAAPEPSNLVRMPFACGSER